MLRGLKDNLRRRVRGSTWAGYYPVLLPHFEVQGEGVRVVGKRFEALPAAVAEGLRLCDGTRTLRDVARESGAKRADLIGQHDQGRVTLWRRRMPPGGAGEMPVEDVVISPHPDDAVLSAFVAAVRGRGRSLVVDVFSRTAWSRFPEVLRTPDEIQAVRRAEERLVMRLLGARLKMLELPEALLRGYTMQEVFTAEAGGADRPVLEALVAAVKELSAELPGARWYLPLAVGGHVDHRLTRDGALDALESSGVPRERLYFYEDLPYAAAVERPDFSAKIAGRRLVPSVHEPGEWTLWDKREALRVYWSQLTWSQIREVEEYTRRRWWPMRPQEWYWQLAD